MMPTKPIWKGSPNFHDDRAGYEPSAIVIHIAEGNRQAVDSWFKSTASQVSAHYLVCTDGSVHQYVREEDTAWHAGRVHKPTWAGLLKGPSGAYVNPNRYTIGIEHEGQADDPWPEAMYRASAQLIREIADRYHIPIDRAHIVGHREIFAVKTCPGSQVDLLYLVDLAAGSA
jgi:N-acetylmuramoyl-L-alanine amidase